MMAVISTVGPRGRSDVFEMTRQHMMDGRPGDGGVQVGER